MHYSFKYLRWLTVAMVFFQPLSFADHECQQIAGNKQYSLSATAKGQICYAYYVASGNMPVLTLKHRRGQADFDIHVYRDNALSNEVAKRDSQGAKSELLVLPPTSRGRYLYLKIENYTNASGSYALYADQIDLADKAGQIFAETAAESLLKSAFTSIFGIKDSDRRSNRSINAMTTAMVSNLAGKNLSETSADVMISDIRRQMVGDGFLDSLIINYMVAIVRDVYRYY